MMMGEIYGSSEAGGKELSNPGSLSGENLKSERWVGVSHTKGRRLCGKTGLEDKGEVICVIWEVRELGGEWILAWKGTNVNR